MLQCFNGATVPPARIQLHARIKGIGDLSLAMHGWRDSLAKVTIARPDLGQNGRSEDDDD